jgi:hypothetical protein
MHYYNQDRTHTGKYCFGKTPMETFLQSIPLAKEMLLEKLMEDQIVDAPTQGANQQFGSDVSSESLLYSNSKPDIF